MLDYNIERFWEKVDKTPGHGPNGDCWLWTGGKINKYGVIKVNKKVHIAHRFIYIFINKIILTFKDCVCHSCDMPSCVNPSHLWVGSRKDNNKDMWAKGRGVVNPFKSIERPEGFNWCSTCKAFKPLINFAKSKGKALGLSNECKECIAKRNKKRVRK